MTEPLLLTCQKCGERVRIRAGEDLGRCEACNSLVPRVPVVVVRPTQEEPLSFRLVLIGSLVLLAAGAFAMRRLRRPLDADSSASAPPQPTYTAPPETPPETAPAGELAWDPDARAPVLLPTEHSGAEDFFGFFRVWDGRSAWTAYGGAFNGATLATLWRTEAIDPQLLKREGVVPLAAVVGSSIVVSDATPTLRVFDLATGNKLSTLRMADAVVEICKPKDATAAGAARVWVHVADEQNALIDLESGKAAFAPRPSWCDVAGSKDVRGGPCHEDFKNVAARAACLPGVEAPALEEGAVADYVLKDGPRAVVLGTKDAHPIAIGVGPGFKASWVTPLVADGTKPLPEAPHVAELWGDRLYAVYGKVYFDARVVALDAESGKRIWDVPLVGSVTGTLGDSGRGTARGLVVSKSRVYVSRSGGGLDVFDAADGKAVGTIGKK